MQVLVTNAFLAASLLRPYANTIDRSWFSVFKNVSTTQTETFLVWAL